GRVVVGFFVAQLEAPAAGVATRNDRYGRPARSVEVPLVQVHDRPGRIDVVVFLPIDASGDRHGDAGDPDVLLLYAVGDPCLGTRRVAVALFDAAVVLGSGVLVYPLVADFRHFAP